MHIKNNKIPRLLNLFPRYTLFFKNKNSKRERQEYYYNTILWHKNT